MSTINWAGTKEEFETVEKIVERLRMMTDERFSYIDADIIATHLNGNPLNLQELLEAPKADFLHDVLGIYRYVDRRNGKLTDCFVPRCSKRT